MNENLQEENIAAIYYILLTIFTLLLVDRTITKYINVYIRLALCAILFVIMLSIRSTTFCLIVQ